jgi:hypothetical protein
LRHFIITAVAVALIISCASINAGPAFFPREFHGIISVQSMPASQCTLGTFYFADTTKTADAGYIPLTASLGMDFAFLFGYVHLVPKFIHEISIGGDGDGFWGFGGALALEAHPFRDAKYDPYLYGNFGYINMPGGGYGGQGYHLDVGGGFVYPLTAKVKFSPFMAYTPVSKWLRKKKVGYMVIDPIIGPEPAYEGRFCTHRGLRLGVSVLFNVFGG